MLYLEALTKIRKNNDFMFLRRYCLFVRLFCRKYNSNGLTKDSKLTYCLLSVHFGIFSYIFQKTVIYKSIGAQFDEMIFCIHEGHDLKIQKMKGMTKDSKFTYCLLSFQGSSSSGIMLSSPGAFLNLNCFLLLSALQE